MKLTRRTGQERTIHIFSQFFVLKYGKKVYVANESKRVQIEQGQGYALNAARTEAEIRERFPMEVQALFNPLLLAELI